MKLKLTGDWVLVEPVIRARITRAGIHMPEGMQHLEPHYGRVIEVGPGKPIEGPTYITYGTDNQPEIVRDDMLLPMTAKPGDMIFYSSLHVYPILYAGKGHFLLHDYEVFCVVEDEDEGEKLRETLVADVEKTGPAADCPEHGKTCAPWYAISEGKKGLYCPKEHKFYPEAEDSHINQEKHYALDAVKSSLGKGQKGDYILVWTRDKDIRKDVECPEHGKECDLMYAAYKSAERSPNRDRKGAYCKTSNTFYLEEELKGE